MISKDFLKGKQKKILLASSFGLLIADLIEFVLPIALFNPNNKYIFFQILYIAFISPQILLYAILAILSFTTWKGSFFNSVLKTYCQRYFLFTDLILSHCLFIILGFTYFTIMLIAKDSDILGYVIFSLSIFQIIFVILLLVGIKMAIQNQSDKDEIEKYRPYYSEEGFFQNPQQKIFLVSLISLVSFTILHFLTTMIFALLKGYKPSILIINSLIGGFAVIIYVIVLIFARVCLKGRFFSKLLEGPFRRYTFILIGILFYMFYMVFQLWLFVTFNKEADKSSLDRFKEIFLLICSLGQFFSIVTFVVALCLAHRIQKDTQNVDTIAEPINDSHSKIPNA